MIVTIPNGTHFTPVYIPTTTSYHAQSSYAGQPATGDATSTEDQLTNPWLWILLGIAAVCAVVLTVLYVKIVKVLLREM